MGFAPIAAGKLQVICRLEAVLQANARTVVLNFSGSPVEMPWADKASTIVQAWYMGSELGNAVADVLFQ